MKLKTVLHMELKMDRQSLTAALRRSADGAEVITKTQFKKFKGISKTDHVQKYFTGLESIEGKYYLISDVVGELMHRMRRSK